ncbi:MAG TPA: FAD-dependent oxidoreductase, partial [Geobacteraceae bacterium]|nr:FAD-dependent oxidoreductase [Geobacteraceae bacterium]
MKSVANSPDLLVAGAGVAGVSAALAAARRGCKVVLLEKDSAIGGTAVGGAVGAICGLYRNGLASPGDILNPGITEEIVQHLLQTSPGRAVRRSGKVFTLPFAPSELTGVLYRLCSAEPGLRLVTEAAVHSVISKDGSITEVSVKVGGVSSPLSPKILVDATGIGELAYLAGADCELSPEEEIQLAGFTVTLEGIKDRSSSLSLKVPFVIAKGVEAGDLPELFRLTVFIEGERDGEGFLKINLPDSAANREKDMASESAVLLKYLAAELEELRDASCKCCSRRVYPREGRRIGGHYTLTGDDILSGARFPDAVVKAAWPMEIWRPGKGASYRYPPDGDYYEIPLRCLKARGLDNLLIAGRCISVTHEAYGSTRVVGAC